MSYNSNDGFGPEILLGAALTVVVCVVAAAIITSCGDNNKRATNTALLTSCEQTTKLGAECRVVAPYTCRTDGNIMTCAVYGQVRKPAEIVPVF